MAAMLLSGQPLVADDSHSLDIAIIDAGLEADSTITVGDRFAFSVEFTHPAQAIVEIDQPDQGSRWSELDRQITTDGDDDTATTRATIDYAVFRPGPTSGPPVSLRVSVQDTTDIIELGGHEVDVEAVSGEDEGLGSPRSPWPLWIESSARLWFAIGTAGIGFIALIGFVALRRRRLDQPSEPLPGDEEIARAALQRLQESDLIANEAWEPFYVRLSETIRRYLGRRWDFPGTELTTTEIIAILETIDDPDFRADVDVIAGWLGGCDRVKFAGYIPSSQRAESDLEQAFEIIEETRKRPKPEDSQGEPIDGEQPTAPPEIQPSQDDDKPEQTAWKPDTRPPKNDETTADSETVAEEP